MACLKKCLFFNIVLLKHLNISSPNPIPDSDLNPYPDTLIRILTPPQEIALKLKLTQMQTLIPTLTPTVTFTLTLIITLTLSLIQNLIPKQDY